MAEQSKKFLDSSGLRKVWNRINAVFAKKTDIPDISVKQDVIGDLADIRTNAEMGANAFGAGSAWNAGTSYTEGTYVIYNNKLWKCILAHSGQTPSDGTYWTQATLKSIKDDIDPVGTVYNWSSPYFNGSRQALPAGTYVFDVQVSYGSASNLAIGLWNDVTGNAVGRAEYFNGSSNSSFTRVIKFSNDASVGTHLYDGTAGTFSSSINAVRIK